MRTRPWEVDDALWQRVEPLIPSVPPGKGPGRPRVADRRVFGAIVYVLRTGAQWKALPRRVCSSSTAHRRFQEWEQAGLFHALWAAGLTEYDQLCGIAWEWRSVDGAMTKAPFGCAATGPNPTDRGKLGVKRSRLTDRSGSPLAIRGASANRHDLKLLIATLDALVVARPEPAATFPQRLCLGRVYDDPEIDDAIADRGSVGHISRGGVPVQPRRAQPGHRSRRWVVEPAPSWINRSRRLLVRWEKQKENYVAFLPLAGAQLLFATIARLSG